MRRARTILKIVGEVGFWFWPLLCGLAWIFGGINPDAARTGFITLWGWLYFLAPMLSFIYYLCVAEMQWSRRLFIVGIVIHLALLVAVIAIAFRTDAGFIVGTLLAVGPVAWLFYAKRVGESKKGSVRVNP